MTGRSKSFLQKQKALMQHDFTKVAGKTFYLKGIYENGTVSVLSGQSSASVQAFSKANCLIVLGEEMVNFHRNDEVEIILLKQ
jgi:molybdopterin biosynthesis enzyme